MGVKLRTNEHTSQAKCAKHTHNRDAFRPTLRKHGYLMVPSALKNNIWVKQNQMDPA